MLGECELHRMSERRVAVTDCGVVFTDRWEFQSKSALGDSANLTKIGWHNRFHGTIPPNSVVVVTTGSSGRTEIVEEKWDAG